MKRVEIIMAGDTVSIEENGKVLKVLDIQRTFVERIKRIIKVNGLMVINWRDWKWMNDADMRDHRIE